MYGVGYLQDIVMFILQYFIYIHIVSTNKAKTALYLNFKKKPIFYNIISKLSL